MSERGTQLLTKASGQLEEITKLLGTLEEADLRKPCPDESGATAGHTGGDTVGASAAHMAEGYHRLGEFLQTAGYVPGSPTTGHHHGHAHASEALPDVRDRLTGGKAPIGLLADLTDEQLDSVPPAINRFSDGRRTLAQVIEAVVAHQAEHLATLKRAVA